MTRSKLSDLNKQEIVSLFEGQQETISSLALRYEVSVSTIRRLLKQPASDNTPINDSEAPQPKKTIISKRSQDSTVSTTTTDSLQNTDANPIPSRPIPPAPIILPTHPKTPDLERSKRQMPRRRGTFEPQNTTDISRQLDEEPTVPLSAAASNFDHELGLAPKLAPRLAPPQDDISEIIWEISHELENVLTPHTMNNDVEDDEVDDEDGDGEFEDLDDEDLEEFADSAEILQLQPEFLLEVMPLADAVLPKTCYLVIDRTSELVTRPLKDFGELGQIPSHETQARTLPVFDNHRIARRFSHRTQRVIKVPNGNMIKATCAQLSAKGITRLLVNGRIYAL